MNEYDLINEIIKTARESLDDAERVLKTRNKMAGIRLRKQMQKIRKIAKQIRVSVQENK
jgi:hypothetical protein